MEARNAHALNVRTRPRGIDGFNLELKLRAQDVANGLRRDWDKSAKLYGVKKVTNDFISRVSGF